MSRLQRHQHDDRVPVYLDRMEPEGSVAFATGLRRAGDMVASAAPVESAAPPAPVVSAGHGVAA
ncbi:MAG: hypothetical protein ACT4PW_10580 [Acidimicrobiia bacterium]